MSAPQSGDEIRDHLPADLDAGAPLALYRFPDNSRRRIPAVLYLVIAAISVVVYLGARSSPLVNGGLVCAAALLAVVGLFSLSAGWRMTVDEKHALVAAQQALQFPVGHASAQQVWHGVRSRPTWRVLCYSAEEPPVRRGLVLVDAVDGRVLQRLVEDNNEA